MNNNQHLTLFVVFCALVHCAFSCIGSIPTPNPKVPARCCPINVFNEPASTGRALFNPELRVCPRQATFICSVNADGNTNPTTIMINGQNTVATGPNGMNVQIMLTCTDQRWKYNNMGTTVEVTSITCLQSAQGK